MIWDIPADAVEWKDGKAYPAGPNACSFEPLPLAEIALKSGRTGGPISAEVSINAQGAGPGFGRQIEESMAVAIDGEIFQDAYLAPLNPESEIYLIPKIGGG